MMVEAGGIEADRMISATYDGSAMSMDPGGCEDQGGSRELMEARSGSVLSTFLPPLRDLVADVRASLQAGEHERALESLAVVAEALEQLGAVHEARERADTRRRATRAVAPGPGRTAG